MSADRIRPPFGGRGLDAAPGEEFITMTADSPSPAAVGVLLDLQFADPIPLPAVVPWTPIRATVEGTVYELDVSGLDVKPGRRPRCHVREAEIKGSNGWTCRGCSTWDDFSGEEQDQ